jgi:hypothetical protein
MGVLVEMEPDIKHSVQALRICPDIMMSKIIPSIILTLFIASACCFPAKAVTNQERVTINDGELHFTVFIPAGWTAQDGSLSDYRLLCPGRKTTGNPTVSIAIGIQPTEGKKATPLFSTDELIETADGMQALIRYYRTIFFQSIIQPTDPSYPGAVVYIQEGDKFVIINMGSDDNHFEDDKNVLKEIVRSYRKVI